MAVRGTASLDVLVISCVYPPDPTSVGQHMADAAAELAARGHRVEVITADRAYDDPSVRFPRAEVRRGVSIRRLPFSSLGKQRLSLRVAGAMLFLLQATLRALLRRRAPDVLLVSTAPPLVSAAAVALHALRGVPVCYWVMDINPDQAVALEQVRPTSLSARVLEQFNRLLLQRASKVVVLDQYMEARLQTKVPGPSMTVLPPWPHDAEGRAVPRECNTFRREHGFSDRFAVMYSGNHALGSPLATVLDAAERLQYDKRFIFAFVGGGVGKREVEERAARVSNIISLPYQPMSRLGELLSAADVQLVVMSERVVGINHPCKVYGAMSYGRPVVLIGPEQCHITDLMAEAEFGWRVAEGDVDGLVSLLACLVAMPLHEIEERGRAGAGLISSKLSQGALCGALCDLVEAAAVAQHGSPTASGVEAVRPASSDCG
jgi:colanic acid biosynthesis glycosyl transferase WcaI